MQIGRPEAAFTADCRAGTVRGRVAVATPFASHRGPPIPRH